MDQWKGDVDDGKEKKFLCPYCGGEREHGCGCVADGAKKVVPASEVFALLNALSSAFDSAIESVKKKLDEEIRGR